VTSSSEEHTEAPAAPAVGDARRILGVDPGLSLTGYGCVELVAGRQEPRLIEGGVLRLKSKAPMAFRLAQLYEDLTGVIDDLRPQIMVVEQLFSHYRHVRTSILMGHARGVVLLAGQSRGVEIDELQPTEVKKAITGHGHATKLQIQQAIMAQCRLEVAPSPPDVADAIAIALCAARRLMTGAA
jgi:crossover junction endodeoxyribonuclease RuvC